MSVAVALLWSHVLPAGLLHAASTGHVTSVAPSPAASVMPVMGAVARDQRGTGKFELPMYTRGELPDVLVSAEVDGDDEELGLAALAVAAPAFIVQAPVLGTGSPPLSRHLRTLERPPRV